MIRAIPEIFSYCTAVTKCPERLGGEIWGLFVDAPFLVVHLWKPFLGILGSHLVAISIY